MLKTRFNETEFWKGSGNKKYKIPEMETSHLLNTLKMFDEKPFRTVRMLVDDIENSIVFTYGNNASEKKQSITNATSMTEQELKCFALDSPVATAMKDELVNRGVNVENIMRLTAGATFDGIRG